jgi:hypothetical protein
MAELARVIETLFFLGLLGSVFVVLLSVVDDVRQMMNDDEQS